MRRALSAICGVAVCRAVRPRLLAPLLLLAIPVPAHAQDDGARLYMMVPDETTIASLRLHRLHSNLAVDPGTVSEGNDLDTTLGVFQFVQALNFTGRQGFVFLVIPASRIEGPTESATGFGDAQLGFVYGIHGTPALSREAYAAHRPGLAINLLGKFFFPTGEYRPGRTVNMGANRWALRLGVPLVYAIGERMADPHLVTIEAMPTVTFFGANDEPAAGLVARQKPLFIFEGHVTRGFTERFWASLDMLWREGGEMETDGVAAGNRQSALSLGATGTLAIGRAASLRLSAGGVVARNEHGPNGWMLRTIFGTVF
ncbi:MAG: transporter [Alphaproteobacteria bacterium]|nr:MAG: transporter [Alphaproteobacteria bacterium]